MNSHLKKKNLTGLKCGWNSTFFFIHWQSDVQHNPVTLTVVLNIMCWVPPTRQRSQLEGKEGRNGWSPFSMTLSEKPHHYSIWPILHSVTTPVSNKDKQTNKIIIQTNCLNRPVWIPRAEVGLQVLGIALHACTDSILDFLDFIIMGH